ncbi:MAG: hypothetical protein IPJ21_01980 [Sterolibacteriaceae bacterium]|nr:hypothetical protein [Sterolibacteriaceae bacterium]MBK9086431.1 hypothetical protein [Sterolibacteriaceae bacterium]
MRTVNIHETKTHLSRLLKDAWPTRLTGPAGRRTGRSQLPRHGLEAAPVGDLRAGMTAEVDPARLRRQSSGADLRSAPIRPRFG